MNIKAKKQIHPFLIFLVCYLAYTSIYVARVNLSMASPGLRAENILSQEQVGMIGSVFFVVYALGRIINGFIGDKTAPWIMISTGLLLSGLSNLFIGIQPLFITLLILWGTNAYAQSMLWSSVVRVVSSVYPPEKAKKMMPFMVTSVAGGNIVGILLNTVFINQLGLRFAFVIPGIVLLFFCVAAVLTTREVAADTTTQTHLPIKELAKNKDMRTMLLPAVFHGMIKDNISLWMTLFFMDQYQIDLEASAAFVLFIPVVGFLGRIAFPFLYKINKEKEYTLAFRAFLLCVAASILLLVKALPPIAALVSLSLIYAAISVINTVFLSYFPLQFAASGNQSSVSGIMDFFTYGGAGIGSLAFGFIVAQFGYSAMFLTYALVSALSLFWMNKMRKKER